MFVSYELALLLKKHGFNEPCFAIYSLGLEKDNFSQLQFIKDYKGELEIVDNFFPKMVKNSDLYVPTAPIYTQVIDWLYEKMLDNENYFEVVYSGSKSREELEEEIKECLKLL